MNISKTGVDTSAYVITDKYKLEPNDILSIKVLSFNKEVSELFNLFQGDVVPNMSIETMAYNSGYVVSDSGHIKLPLIGKISVVGKTIDETRDLIQEKVDAIANDATVFVKLSSFKVTVLGEVRSPGVKQFIQPKVNILEVLGSSGDVNDLGDKRNVLIVRQSSKGYLTYRVDLTDPSFLKNKAFYVLPHDIVYVEARKAKGFRLEWQNITIVVSMLTTIFALYGIYRKF